MAAHAPIDPTTEPFFPRHLRARGWVPHAARGPIAWAALNAKSAKFSSASEVGDVPGWIQLLNPAREAGAAYDNALVLAIARREFKAGRIISFCRKSGARKGIVRVGFSLLPPADALPAQLGIGHLSHLDFNVDIGEVLALSKIYRERDAIGKASNQTPRKAERGSSSSKTDGPGARAESQARTRL